MKFSVTGAIVHGRLLHTVLWTRQWSHDSNHNFTVLLETLALLTADGTVLPKVLKLIMDNGPAENKNQTMIFNLWLLVYCGVFDRVLAFFDYEVA